MVTYMKCAKYMKICREMKARLHSNAPWNFWPMRTCFVNIVREIKSHFLACIYEHVLLVLWNLEEQRSFAESPKPFGQSSWNFFFFFFTDIHVKRKMWRQLFVKQTETITQSHQLVITYSQNGTWRALSVYKQ